VAGQILDVLRRDDDHHVDATRGQAVEQLPLPRATGVDVEQGNAAVHAADSGVALMSAG